MTTAMPKTTTAMHSLDKLQSALKTKFPPGKVDEVLHFFNLLTKEAWLEHWDTCLVNSGKFVEAVFKCFHYLNTGIEVDSIKVDEEVRSLEQAVSLNNFERLTIPRNLRLIYEFRNRRGGAHNSSFDPIRTDCVLVVALAKWVIEEMARLYLTNDALAAQALVTSLLVKEVPLIEKFGEDRLVLSTGLSARIQLELLLWDEYPNRCTFKDLVRWIHNHSVENIRMTLRTMRQKNLAHETEDGWLLTALGIDEAEEEIAKLKSTSAKASTASKSRTKGARRGRK